MTSSTTWTAANAASGRRSVVGVVGVGAMGMPIALRLQADGQTVRAVDASAERAAQCRDQGLDVGTDLALLAGCDVVIAIVATGPQLLDLLESDVVTGGDLAGAVLVVASTVGPDVLRDAVSAAAAHGLEVVDCPVSGGVPGAKAGTLLLFAAGAPAALDTVQPVLELLGRMHVVGTRPGDGQALKLVNQMLASIHLAAAGEAVAFAERLGLDPDVVVRLLPMGAAASWMLADRGPRMVVPIEERTTETQLSILVKDSGLVVAAAAAAGAQFPLMQAARDAWQRAADLGLSTGDDSGIVEVFRQGGSPGSGEEPA